MPTNNAPHKFAIGQDVVFMPTAFDHNTPRGGYVITRTLPGDDFDATTQTGTPGRRASSGTAWGSSWA